MFATIMAGGSGTRFWPASREHLPKQFLKIISDRTLFEDTLARIKPIIKDECIYVVINRLHESITHQLLHQTAAEVLIEPVGRNTAACIGLAAIHASRVDADEPMFVLPSDHFIADTENFISRLQVAADIARTGAIVTLGILPTRPETGFGYISIVEETTGHREQDGYRVKQFVEKPDYATAVKYLADGRHLWNSGIFIFTAKTILREIEILLPNLYAGLQKINQAIGTAAYAKVLQEVYPDLPSISIDYGVMEKTTVPVYSLKGDFGWSDVGSWQALYELHGNTAEAGNVLLTETMAVDSCHNLVFSSQQRRVSLLGIEGLVIVDTADELLIADMKRSQEVKYFPETLRQSEAKA